MTVKQAQSLPSLKTKSSRRFKPASVEQFVLCKPPPSVSTHHPLNLQIQYIPPSSAQPKDDRRRRTSSSSEKSGSESSANSSRSGRIVPLYNLHTHSHNLLANSIHDAGTDEKIAKFQKQGVEFVNLGLFAPYEAWSTASCDSEDVPSAIKLPAPMDISSSLPEPVNEPPRKLLGKFFHAKAPTTPEPAPNLPLPDFHPEYALAPILGTTPTLLSRTVPPQGRAVAYTWICKKWFKEGDENWLTQPFHFANQDKIGVDIRIEWARKRDSDPPSRKPSTSDLQSDASPIPPVPSLPTSPSSEDPRGRSPLTLTIPGSPMFGRRKATSPNASTGRNSDVEYDSDPEDSEVPWIATVVIRASKSLTLPHGAAEAHEPPLRLKVASLAQAPHHPKVVAQLKMQYPLPDVDLYEAVLLQSRRVPGAPGSQPEGRFVLTAEEIKDIVCTTSMWVVIREGFSGLTKKCKPRLS